MQAYICNECQEQSPGVKTYGTLVAPKGWFVIYRAGVRNSDAHLCSPRCLIAHAETQMKVNPADPVTSDV